MSVAIALGEELLRKVVFVGGCTTGLLVTDEYTREQIRYTDDVDLIVDVIGKTEWFKLREQLRKRGFTEAMDDEVVCRMRLDGLKVDFMPDDGEILGFTNRWYADSLVNSFTYKLMDDLTIQVVSAPYFLATKLEAYQGRGNNDPMMSHDIEDIFNIIMGRHELIDEIFSSDPQLQIYLKEKITELMSHADFESAVAGNTLGDSAFGAIVFDKLEKIKAP